MASSLFKPSKVIRLALILVASCAGATDPPVETPQICDGQPSLKLFFRLAAGFIPPPSGLHYENGGTFLAVDGQCRYFTNYHRELTGWPEVRTGTLGPSKVDHLVRRLRVSRWANIGDANGGNPNYDHHVLSLWTDGKNVATCLDACEAAEVKSMSAETEIAAKELWTSGKPNDGPVRISMIRDGTLMRQASANENAVAWLLKMDLDSVLLPPSGMYATGGMGMLVEDPDDFAALKSMRRHFQDGAATNVSFDFIPIKRTPEAARYDFILHIRDAIPYEDTRGLIPLKW